MAASLGWTVDERSGCAVVAVHGVLDLAGAPRLRTVLMKCLAEQPDALVIDLSAMAPPSSTMLSLFVAVNRQAARWPGTPVLLCSPPPATAALLTRGAYGSLTVYPSVAEALDVAIRGAAVMPAFSDQLLPVSGAVRHARDLATEACVTWRLDHLVAPASLIAGELVANVVDHVGTMMTLRLSRRLRYLHVSVRDGSPDEPRITSRRGDQGRGLLLVDDVAVHWGSLPTADGKVVWATLAVALR